MKCACPKCSADIEIQEPSVPEKGQFVRCPECRSNFWTNRESFINRVYKKEWKIYCSACGEELGKEHFCESCYARFPDYWVVQGGKPVRRSGRVTKPALPSPLKISKRKRATVTRKAPQQAAAPKAEVASRRPAIIGLAVLAAVIILALVGGNLYLQKQRALQFASDYVKVLFGIKSGTDLGFNKLEEIAAAHRPLSGDDIAKLTRVKGQIDRIHQTLENPPQQFQEAVDTLGRMYKIFNDIDALATTASGNSPGFPDEVTNLQNNLAKVENELKNRMPPEMSEELGKVVFKYTNLKPLLK